MPQSHLRLSPEAVARLTKLLADLGATAGIEPAHRYEVAYYCDQVRERLPAIEGLVIAGLLHEAPTAAGPGPRGTGRLLLVGR
jgi:hypothetical protein